MSVDWTLSLSNIVTYAGMVAVIAWRMGIRLTEIEATIRQHTEELEDHGKLLRSHEDKFDRAMMQMGDLSRELQRLIGRCEMITSLPTRKGENHP